MAKDVDEESATIAASLVMLVVRQVSAKRIQVYGYTAAQVVSKIEIDPTAMAIAGHLVSELSAPELEIMLLKELPERYFANLFNVDEGEGTGTLARLSHLFHDGYEVADDNICEKVARRFMEVLKSEPGNRVQVYESNFFCVDYLNQLDDVEEELVMDQLLESFGTGIVEAHRLNRLEGISAFIDEIRLVNLFDPFLRTVGYSRDDGAQKRPLSGRGRIH
jgi:hypothetical protein